MTRRNRATPSFGPPFASLAASLLNRRSRRLAAITTLACAALLLPAEPALADGKLTSTPAGKRVGKGPAKVLPASMNRAVPLTLASAGKTAAPAPHVRDALLGLGRLSAVTPSVRMDPRRGSLQRFSGKVVNPHGKGPIAAVRMLVEHRDALGILAAPDRMALVQRHMSQEPGDGLHLVLDVQYDGLPVWGAEVAAHFDEDGALTSINAQRLGTLRPAMSLRYGPEAAQQRARRWNAAAAGDGAVQELGTPQLGVWPGRGADDGGALAWKLVQSLRTADGLPQHYATYVDGNTGAVLARHALVHTEKVTATTGTANNLFGKQVTLRISHYEDKNQYALFDQSKGLAAATLQTFDADHSQFDKSLATAGSKTGWSAPLATAHDHMQQVIDYFSKTHGRNSWDGQGAQVRQIVHFGQDFNNAFWDSYAKHMAIGDGDEFTFKSFTRALDVSAHEFSHAVVTGTVDLVYQGQPGALNESFADVMSTMVDRDDWLIGEEIVGPQVFPQGYARSFIDPEGGNQPAHMDQLYKGLDDYGGVHINSGIPNHAAYLLAQAKSREVVEKIWYRTLYKDHIGSYASFIDMAQGTLTACDELVASKTLTAGDCTATAQAWVKVGVLGAADVPMDGCPTNASEKGGVCYCDPGYAPNGDGSACVAVENVQCPQNAIEGNGQCFCKDGFKPSADNSQCVAVDKGCPLNSGWDAAAKACKCDPGFEGAPNAADGKCEAVESDCPVNAHPIFDGQQMGVYVCGCNENFQDDGQGGCEVVPGTCGNESFFGRCDADTLTYCDLGGGDPSIAVVDCKADGLICGKFDSIVGFDCLNPTGVAAGGKCAADSYQVCDDTVPFCVSQEGDPDGFCSHECKAKSECQATASEKAAFDCCASVSDGTRACLKDPYCAENIDTKASCDDVPGGSTYFGKCNGDVLIYCDGSTDTTQEVFCNKQGLDCGWVDKTTGYSCVEPDSGALPEAPDDWCPYEGDGVCDAPERCPEGTDLLDCNPCGEVPAAGVCVGEVLKVCDAVAGLVTTNCAEQDATPECGEDGEGQPACIPGEGGEPVPTEGGGDDTVTPDTEANGDAGGADGGSEPIACTCRGDAGTGGAGLWVGALGLLFLRRRKRG
jgi:bacillolysin